MFNSIQQFETAGIKNLRKAEDEFIRTRDMANFINAIKEVVLHLGLDVIAETLENYDEAIRKSPKRSEKWSVVRKDPKQLVTSLGTVQYRKTLFINKTTKERSYLLDRELSLEKHQRITEDAEAQLLTEAVQTTYRKGGEAVSILDDVSKETVMDKIRTIDFTKVHKAPETLREIPYLYIDADEDHVALQFHEHKGDVRTNAQHRKDNCVLAKMVYVYEGIEPEAPGSKRHRLINPHYFCGVYDGADNDKLWQEVYDYLDETYDLTKVKKVYLNADSGSWIQGAKKRLHGLTRVMDEFHLNKYLLRMTGGLLDSAGDARRELVHQIKKGTQEGFGHETEHKFSIGVSENGALVGVAICGRPVARRLDDGYTLEVNRLCTDGTPNACSILYAAAYRAARAMGYNRVVTYILDTENGASLKAAGYTCEGRAGGLEWNGAKAPKQADQYPRQMKTRWVKKKEGLHGS